MKDSKIYYCVVCGKIHNKGDFYTSYNRLHKNEVYPFCKDYIKKVSYDIYDKFDIVEFKEVLRQLDAPYIHTDMIGSLEDKRETVGAYFSRINMKQNRDLTWKDSEFEDGLEYDEDAIDLNKEIENMSNSEKNKLQEIWGHGYSNEELYLFNKKYLMLRNNYDEKTAMHKEALFNYVRYRCKEEIATKNNDVKEAKEWSKLASDAASAAKINPSQLSKADLSDGLSTFSELSEAVEKVSDIIPILPKFKYRPNDALDFNIWCYVNYIRDLSGLPPCDYEDVYKFYDRRKEDYVKQYGDPYGIFTDDTSENNRENIEKFIKEEE